MESAVEQFGTVIVLFFQYAILVYFLVIVLSYAIFGYLGVRAINRYYLSFTGRSLQNILEGDVYIPISIIVPAYNEEKTIVGSVLSFLSLHYPVLEVVVVADGPKDQTVARLIEHFGLEEVDYLYELSIPCKNIRRVLRSPKYPKLLVVDKDNGGKADALNAGFNFARYPLLCAVDADSLLDVEALVRAARFFLQDEEVVAVGGSIMPLNGAEIRDGQIVRLRIPKTWIERLQILEYSRAFFTGRAGWAEVNALLIVSGAFGVFRRDAMIAVGGYAPDSITEDMEVIMRMHRYFRSNKKPYKIPFIPDPLCWTEVPSDWKTLRKQRNRWHRGLWDTLWRHRGMTFNPRYGIIGIFSIPYYWLVEAVSPIIEVFGYVFVLLAIVLGLISPQFVILFLLLASLYGIVVSMIAISFESLLMRRYNSLNDRIILISTSIMEFVGYRQILLWERFRASFQWRKHGSWGEMTRKGF